MYYLDIYRGSYGHLKAIALRDFVSGANVIIIIPRPHVFRMNAWLLCGLSHGIVLGKTKQQRVGICRADYASHV